MFIYTTMFKYTENLKITVSVLTRHPWSTYAGKEAGALAKSAQLLFLWHYFLLKRVQGGKGGLENLTYLCVCTLETACHHKSTWLVSTVCKKIFAEEKKM